MEHTRSIIIITGASSGLGVCFAKQISQTEKVDELWLIARRENLLNEVKSDIEPKSLIPSIKVFPIDLEGQQGAINVKNIIEEEVKTNGKLNISVLINNAGFGTYGEFANTDVYRQMQMVDLNCTSLTGITGFALPYMEKGARIINTASLASFMPLGNFAVYGASKAYVLNFTVALAAELKDKGIKVTALCPGPVSTNFANVASKGARKEVKHGLSPEKTVAHCLKCSKKGKLYSLWAFKWKFKASASRFVGRYIGAWFTYKFCKRPSN